MAYAGYGAAPGGMVRRARIQISVAQKNASVPGLYEFCATGARKEKWSEIRLMKKTMHKL